MKFNNKLIAFSLSALALASCTNGDIEFDDYEGGITVYFPYQTPVRTIVLGSDEYDTTLDKQHKCKISATMGGAYEGRNIVINYAVDNSLCDNLKMEDGSAVTPMPAEYYSLSDSKIAFKGELTGSVEVQLSDAFFADPASATNKYVIPLRMTSQTGAKSILSGSYDTEAYASEPAHTNSDAWKVLPKDYVLYCVSYNNKYDAYYSRCGKYSFNGATAIQIPAESTAKYQGHFDPVVDGEICNTVTKSLNTVSYAVKYTYDETTQIEANLLLTFDGSDNCTVTSLTEGVTASGSGKFVAEGAKKAWGDKDRDQITLQFTLDDGKNKVSCDESLVWMRSGVKLEELKVSYVAE